MRLPNPIDPAFFDERFRPDTAAWHVAVVEVCAAHRIECSVVAGFPDGSNLVLAVNDRWVVKIFPPFHEHQWESERRALAHLQRQKLPLKVPELFAEGTRDDGWPYVIIEKLPGSPLEACWTAFAQSDKEHVLEQIGATIAAVHDLPLEELAELPPEWSAFLRDQQAGCRRKHTERGVPQWFERGVDELIGRWAPDPDSGGRVMLTGEYTPFNLLVQRDAAGWRLTGMIDFGDAMIGPRDYDLLGPSMFSCGGDARLVAALFRGYFGPAHAIDHEWRMRLMALAVLHRYANFDVQLRIPNWRERACSFETLAELIWPEDGVRPRAH